MKLKGLLFLMAISCLFVTRSVHGPPSADAYTVNDYRLIALGTDTNPREIAKLYGAASWTQPVAIAGLTSDDPRVWPVGKRLWFVTNDDGTAISWGWGVGRRTKDGGQTWTTPGDPGLSGGGVIHYAADAGGRLWALWQDSSPYYRTKLSYSDDAGDTWSAPVFTMGSGAAFERVRGWKILTHPTDSNIIAVVGFSSNYFGNGDASGWIAKSTARGATGTWTIYQRPELDEGQYGVREWYDAVMLPSSRIVVQGPFHIQSPIKWSTFYTDDLGSTLSTAWSVEHTPTRINGLFWKDSRVAFIRSRIDTDPDQHRLMLSFDNGSTFGEYSLPQELESFVGASFVLSRFTMSTGADSIYLGTSEFATKKIVRLTPVQPNGTWFDETGNYPHTNFGNDNLAIVPNSKEPRNVYGGPGPGGCATCPHNGDPVNLATGNFSHQHTDIQIPAGKGLPLQFTRAYNSQDSTVGRLGPGWQDNYNIRLLFSDADHGIADVTVIGEFGRQDDYLRQVDGTYLAPPGVSDPLTRNPGDGSFDLKRRDTSTLHFDGSGVLQWMRDRNGSATNQTSFTYVGGKLTSATDSAGRALTFSYENSTFPDRITKVTDPILRTVVFAYDPAGDLTQVTDVKVGITTYSYNANHRMTSLTDANGHQALQNWYDSAGRVAEQQDATGGKTCIYYGSLPTYTSGACAGITPTPSYNETAVVDPRGNKTTHTYDPSFRTTDIKDANGGVIHYDYDPASDNRICVTDQLGRKTGYVYDASGNILEAIDALNTNSSCQLKAGGVRWVYTYTSLSDIASGTEPLMRRTDYVYDSIGNLTRIARKDSATGPIRTLACFEHDTFGLTTATVESTDLQLPGSPTGTCIGNRTLLGYDGYGNQTCVVNARHTATTSCTSEPAPKTTLIYDVGGRMLFATNELVNSSRPVKGAMPEYGVLQCGTLGTGNGTDDDDIPADDAIADDGCGSVRNSYDEQNNVKSVIDGIGNKTSYDYDAKGIRTSVTDANRNTPVGSVESGSQCGVHGTGDGFDNDPGGSDGVIDDGCLSAKYSYDDGDRLVQVVGAAFASGTSTVYPISTFGYDVVGNRISVTNANRQPSGSPEAGTQCPVGTDTDWDGTCDASDNDDDNDGVQDTAESSCGSNSLVSNLFPERTDGSFASSDEDSDTLSDEGLPVGSAGFDCDGDGYTTSAEAGTPLCTNAVNDDGVDDSKTNDGCPALETSEFSDQCSTSDDDSDGKTNDGCPQVGSFSEAIVPGACDDAIDAADEDPNTAGNQDDDSVINDGCPSAGPANPETTGTRCDNAINDHASGTLVNDGCPVSMTYREDQFNIGTGAQARCQTSSWPSSSWPSDLGGSGTSGNKIDVVDLATFISPIRRMDTKPGDANFNMRWDLIPGPISPTGVWINVQDLSAVSSGGTNTVYPPMMGGTKAFNGPTCPSSGVSPLPVAGAGDQCGSAGTGDGVDADGDTIKDDGCPSLRYTYDRLNRLQTAADALGGVTTYQYDAAGNLVQRKDGRGLMTRYAPDALNRVTRIEYWSLLGLQSSVDLTFDDVGNRKTMVDSTGTTNYAYDTLNRLTCVGPNSIGGSCPSGNTAYTYDDLPGGSVADYPGQRTKITYPDPLKYVTYTYEKDGRMSLATDWVGTGKRTKYSYDSHGRLEKAEYLDANVEVLYTYDIAGRITKVTNKKVTPSSVISEFTYTPDAVGNRKQMVAPNGTHTYKYDSLHRLIEVTYPGPVTDAYTYDAVGNRLTKNGTGYTYDAADQLLTAGSTNYAYDKNGNQTSRVSGSSDIFAYDHENRLTSATVAGQASSSSYNGDGLRITHTAGATTTYKWDIAASLPVVLQDDANTYVYGLDLISATDSSPTPVQTYFLYDGLGSTVNLTDGSGTVTATYTYDVFGAHTGGGSNQWLFTGEQRDGDSSLYYLRARYYDPAIGRFLGRDPLPGGNLYAYVGSNPVNYADPSGLHCKLGHPYHCGEEIIDVGQCVSDLPSCPVANAIGELISLIPEGTLLTLFEKYHISYQLVAVCISDRTACAAAFAMFPVANEVRNLLYSSKSKEGTIDKPKEGDAFQHCLWSGLITLQVGASRAENVTSAYEAYGDDNPDDEREYDMANNKRGREFAQLMRGNPAGALALLQYCQ